MYPSSFKNEGVTLVVNWSEALDQLLPRPVRARISGPKGPEILVCFIIIFRRLDMELMVQQDIQNIKKYG